MQTCVASVRPEACLQNVSSEIQYEVTYREQLTEFSFMNYPDEASTGQALPHAPVLAITERQEFWTDTCREVTQMRLSSQKVIDLYRRFGCRFCVPAHDQVEHVLNALDLAIPSWEEQHPELFYQTLELNFPELVRHP